MQKKNFLNCDREIIRAIDLEFNASRQRDAFRASCTHRRNRNRIEKLEQGRWILDSEFKTIARAKRYSRTNLAGRIYAV